MKIFDYRVNNEKIIVNFLGIKISIKVGQKLNRKICHCNYKKVLIKLQKDIKKRPLKVIFLVAENSKWGYQSLYDLFNKSEYFNPTIILNVLKETHTSTNNIDNRCSLEENYMFFKTRGMNVEYGYKNDNWLDLSAFLPDIVFYEQPWQLPDIYKPLNLSKKYLTCYLPYGLPLMDYWGDYNKKFHPFLWREFIDSKYTYERLTEYAGYKIENMVEVGYSKLDKYIEKKSVNINIWKSPEKYKIIYAPHHSFDKKINCSTFIENGNFILNLAKRHPETTWIFKPHPRLKYALIKNNIMTEKEVEEYFKEWEEIGTVYTQGDYFDIFKTSDLMVTDCCSFLGEYLPTGKPVIRPIHAGALPLNKLGEKIVEGYYNVNNNEELENTLIDLIKNKNDYKKEIRQNTIPEIIDFKEKSAQKIYNYILKCLKGNGE